VLVFVSPHGLPVHHSNFLHRIWAPAVKAVGLDLRPHDLRASHATWLYDAGWSPVEIAARLGHAKATITTKHYARRVVGRLHVPPTALGVEPLGVLERDREVVLLHGVKLRHGPVAALKALRQNSYQLGGL